MSGYGEFLGEYKDSLDQLKYVLDQSERSVNQLYEGMGKFVSQKEKDSEAKYREIIKKYKEIHAHLFEKFQHLKDKLSRKTCQIFIYGKVSTGKSKIINAILRKEIFHSASSHTTSCFVKICKSSDQSHHIEYKNGKDRYDQLDDLKNKIKEMSTVFCKDKNKLETKELLTVYLNIPDNKILTSSTEIIDCPGSANKESITNYIKDKALNSNIFIFVLTSGISDYDEVFFQYQWEQSSKPIIFILINKWDQAYNDGEDAVKNSKKKITEELIEFFTNKLNLSENDAKKQIFFISALNICRKRNIGKGNFEESEDYENRCRKFEEFEMTLSNFINKLIETKFIYYNEEFNKTKKEINKNMEKFKTEFLGKSYFKNILIEWQNYKSELKKSLKERLNSIEKTENDFIQKSKDFVNNCRPNLYRHTIQLYEEKINNLVKDAKIAFQNLQMDTSIYVDDEIRKYKTLTYTEKNKKKFDLKEMMQKEIKLTTIPDTFWELFLKKITDYLTVLRHYFVNNLKNKDFNLLKENIKKIESAIEELNKHESGKINELSGNLKTDINEMIEQLDNKIIVYIEFLENIANLFQLK